jgi:hypothetical protein
MNRTALAMVVIAGGLAITVGLRATSRNMAAVPSAMQSSPIATPAASIAPVAAVATPAAAPEVDSASTASMPTIAPPTDEEEARHIDDLVAAGRLGEAHAEAMDFVQEHPSGPLTSHVMNLMGVHARPAGAVPPTPRPDPSGR